MAGRDSSADDDEELASADDDPRTFQKEGWAEEIGPAASEEEWYDARADQLDEAAQVDDPVEAREVSALWSLTEGDPNQDATELADTAAPEAPEDEALLGSLGVQPEDEEELTVGLPPGTNLEAASDDWLVEAELVAISEGDPETAALIAEELTLRGRRSGPS